MAHRSSDSVNDVVYEDLKKAEASGTAVHKEFTQDARDHETTAWQCIKENPKIVMYVLYANIGSIMIGYDNLSLAVCLAMPAFQ